MPDIPQPSKSPDSPPTIVPHVTPFVSDSETTASSSREFQSDTTITDGRPSPTTTPESDAGKVSEAQVDAADEASDAGSGGAYNPVTGEINWDCPCLGGMAHGPCGPEFREAFACFVYSEDEPKGINCVEKFKGMQDCFRAHPDVYADGLCSALVPWHRLTWLIEIMDDEDEEPAHAIPDEVQPASDDATTANISPIPVKPKLEKGKLEEVPSEATPSSQS